MPITFLRKKQVCLNVRICALHCYSAKKPYSTEKNLLMSHLLLNNSLTSLDVTPICEQSLSYLWLSWQLVYVRL
jgi:hypothetical protein